jgi:hypothetical protein
MSFSPLTQARSNAPLSNLRFQSIVEAHFHPEGGSPYWISRARELGIDPSRDLQRPEDLDLLGLMDAEALRQQSVWDFVPLRLHAGLREFITAETGGTTGTPMRTAYRGRDFQRAFVDPFLAVAGRFNFPHGKRWVYLGPGGPHVIGKAARAVARAMGSPDPFAIDFDPRWYRAQPAGGLLRRGYLEHILDQALVVLEREPIEVLFGTPPVLVAMATRLHERARRRIEAVHLGGLAAEPEEAAALREQFPRAVFLAGYGNTLLGMCPQIDPGLEAPAYYPHGERLWIRLSRLDAVHPLRELAAPGERGRVLASRLDKSFLIANLLDRDTAVRLPPHPHGAGLGFRHEGLGDPRPLAEVPRERLGIY